VWFEAELFLMAGAAGLYLFDSALLLYANEGILSPCGKRGWDVRFGSNHFRMRGRDVYLPNPLLPHRPQFRLFWQPRSDAVASGTLWQARRALFRPLAPLVWGMTVALFVLLPLGLFTRLGEQMLMAAIVLLYLSIIAALVQLGIRRTEFGLSAGRFALLAFESLVCSPLALNLIRRISAEMPIGEDLAQVARHLQTPEAWRATQCAIVSRVDEELEMEDEGSERAALLWRYREGLLAGEPPCR